MIPADIESRRKVIAYMLTLAESEVGMGKLTSWEENFVGSVKDQFKTKQNLSDRQCEVLEQIYDKL